MQEDVPRRHRTGPLIPGLGCNVRGYCEQHQLVCQRMPNHRLAATFAHTTVYPSQTKHAH